MTTLLTVTPPADRQRQEIEQLREKVNTLYKKLDRANEAIAARNRKIERQDQKLLDYATEIDDLHRENEYFKAQYNLLYIQLDKDRARSSLYQNHGH
jgi:cupin superfamily acireductone dioxygenase involved in methionine salvage